MRSKVTSMGVSLVAAVSVGCAGDRNGRVASVADSAGVEIVTNPLEAQFRGGAFALVDSALILGTFEQTPGSERRIERVVMDLPGQTVELAAVEVQTKMAHYPSCGTGFAMPPIFERDLLQWDARGRRVAVTAGREYVIDLYEGGRKAASLRRDLVGRPATEEMALRHVRGGQPVGDCTIPAEELLRGRGHASTLPAIQALALAPDGTLWVLRGTVKGDPAPIDLFTANGAYLGTLSPGSPFPAAFLPDSGMVAIERDSLDLERLAFYRVAKHD